MMKHGIGLACAVLVLFTSGCENKKTGEAKQTESGSVAPKAPAVATHLGFATHVPKDADFFIEGIGADALVKDVVKSFIKPEDIKPEDVEKFQDALDHVGDEAFAFVGAGLGKQLEMTKRIHSDFSAMTLGMLASMGLDKIEGKNGSPDITKANQKVIDEMMDRALKIVEKDGKIQLPCLVLGWKPDAAKEAKCVEMINKWMNDYLATEKFVRPVKFEASGVSFTGYEAQGRELFAEVIAKAREELKDNKEGAEFFEQLTPERIERVLAAMENLRLTVATGTLDGRVLIYLGNGPEGFRLAASPAESLAASEDMLWTGEYATKRMIGVVHCSESMVRSVLPLVDLAVHFDALADAIRPPVQEQRLFRELLKSLADGDRALGKRDASAWTALCFLENGLHIETHGGWPDPGLDYETPLRMTEAAIAMKPAIRLHKIVKRERNDLEWEQMERFGALIHAVIDEVNAVGGESMAMIPQGTLERVVKEVTNLNRAYREEFHVGIGDEVALIADMQGEIPTFPGISEETVKNARMPRFLYARPVKDRAMLTASGKSFVKSWRDLTAWGSELSKENLPLIVPQSVESGGLITWYPPLPFIGGDFMPGVSLNDKLWMVGTSRSMAGGFAKSMESSKSGGETGAILEIDFAPIRDWLRDVYQRNEKEADKLTKEAPDEVKELAKKQNLERVEAAMNRLEGLSCREWMAGGKPRASLHLRIGPAR